MTGILRILQTAFTVATIAASAAYVAAQDNGLPALAEESATDFEPITTVQLNTVRAELISAAAELERALGGDTPLSIGWKRYLHWSSLAPHLDANEPVTRRNLDQLSHVLERFRANRPGLELPVFVRTANAIERFRPIASWAVSESSLDTRALYQQLLRQVGQQLKRHAEHPTSETELQIGRAIAIVDALGQSPNLVDAVQTEFGRPNIFAFCSDQVVRALGQRPVDNRQPVRDAILGTQIYGSSRTLGSVSFALRPGADHVSLAVGLSGQTYSNTNGYNGPVVIRSRSTTTISAEAQLRINDAAFRPDATTACANTKADIQSICKTGGNFGRKMIEKIAWRRAGEQKSQSERIASQHASVRVRDSFIRQLSQTLTEARTNYEQKVRAPLIRQGAFPERLIMTSNSSRALIEATFASSAQLGADSPPPATIDDVDFSLRIHQTAVGNYLAMAIGGAIIKQGSADEPPQLAGDVPPWLSEFAGRDASLSRAAAQPAENDQVVPFKPWSLMLNSAAPASVGFDNGRLTIRIRAALLTSDENEFANWDFIVHYAVAQRDNMILVRRDGDIEVFPTLFDPRWDQRLSAQQSGLRNTLAKNINARADAGQGFPAEIAIGPIHPPLLGELDLIQLQSEDGWLTLGWRLR